MVLCGKKPVHLNKCVGRHKKVVEFKERRKVRNHLCREVWGKFSAEKSYRKVRGYNMRRKY